VGVAPDCKIETNLKSFLFTLKSPHNVPARKFALKAEKKGMAILYYSDRDSYFWDTRVHNNCNVHTDSSIDLFGDDHTNNTGLAGSTFVTGCWDSEVKEIIMFEIMD
jgi:hypothetical protein